MDARTFLSQAQKAESGAGGGWFNFNKQDKLEDAAELYVKAGNAFNTSGQPVDAGNAYEKAAYVYEQLNEPDSAARHRLDAFTALRKTTQWQQGVQNLEKAIQHNSSSNINRAADNQKKLGEFWEEKGGKGTENQNPEFLRLAVEAFAKAGGWYLQTGMDANGNKCLIKDAEISAYLGDFFRAFNTYEGVTRETGQNEILSWSKREWLMMAGLCRLADGDIISAKREIPNYWRLEKSFVPPNCGELNFLMDLLEAIEGQDEEKYEQAKFKHQMYFQSNQLRAWLVNVAKEKNITEAGDDLT